MTDKINPNEPFRKPHEVCQVIPNVEGLTDPEEIKKLVADYKLELENQAKAVGCTMRIATRADMGGILGMMREQFTPEVAALVSEYDTYRAVVHGYTAVIVHDETGEMLGADISAGYDSEDRTSFGVIITVSPKLATLGIKGMGTAISIYTSLLGMERNGYIRRGIVKPDNLRSINMLTNKTGFLCESYYPNLFGEDDPRFILSFPLTPGGIRNNKLDVNKAVEYIKSHKNGDDYMLIETGKNELIEDMYLNTPFRIMGIIPPRKLDTNDDKSYFLAFTKERLNFPAHIPGQLEGLN